MASGTLALTGLLGIGSIVCFIIVLIKLFQQEGALYGVLGLICGIYTLIWGWQNADKLRIRNVMLIWSILIGLSIVLRIGLMTMSR
jgi:hypothetical protein